MINVGFVGSREYNNPGRIRAVILKFIEQYGKDGFTVVSGGCPTGADYHAKVIANELGVKYLEYAPAHFQYQPYMVGSPEDYGKSYSASNYHIRNRKIAENCKVVMAFVMKCKSRRGTDSTLRFCEECKTEYVLFED
jgi:predicted Rossmann-fold nucleotide-binding protein